MSDRLPEPAAPGAPPASPEAALLARARAGDVDAVGALFAAHATAVRRLLRSVLGPDDELDDLVQEVFLQLHRSIRRFRGDAGLATWLHRLTVNTAISHLRCRSRRRARIALAPTEGAADGGARGPHERAEATEMVRHLYAILEAMPLKRRVAFALFELEGVPLERLAAALGITVAAAKSRVFFARREVIARAAADPCLAPLVKEIGT